MIPHTAHHTPNTSKEPAASPAVERYFDIFTVDQIAERNPAFTSPALRNLIFKAEPRQSSKGPIPGNGLAETGAIIRLGRRVLIRESSFLAWVARGGSAK